MKISDGMPGHRVICQGVNDTHWQASILQLMREALIPGLALAIVDNDEIATFEFGVKKQPLKRARNCRHRI